MTDIGQKKESVKMHLEVTEDLIIPQPDDVKNLMIKMDQLLKLIESK